jgi:hypothetical protein
LILDKKKMIMRKKKKKIRSKIKAQWQNSFQRIKIIILIMMGFNYSHKVINSKINTIWGN